VAQVSPWVFFLVHGDRLASSRCLPVTPGANRTGLALSNPPRACPPLWTGKRPAAPRAAQPPSRKGRAHTQPVVSRLGLPRAFPALSPRRFRGRLVGV
jgi:hypothetical protein